MSFIKAARHRFEWPFFALAAAISVIIFSLIFGLSLYQTEATQFLSAELVSEYRAENPEQAEKMTDAEILDALSDDERALLDTVRDIDPVLVALFPLGLVLSLVYMIGKMYGEMRADGIKITARQFPEVHAIWVEMAAALGLKKIPDLFVKNGNGTLNAFATCVPGYRAYGVIYSDILEKSLADNDLTTIRFILGHELGHIRLGHVRWWYFLATFAANLPGLNYVVGLPLSRAREYGCDKIGAHLSGDDGRALLILAAGKHLYSRVDLESYCAEQIERHNHWDALYNVFNDHPNINWRVAAIREQRHGDLFFAKKLKR